MSTQQKAMAEYAAIFLIFLLLLLIFPISALAGGGGGPYCGRCRIWDGDRCVPRMTCPSCQHCSGGRCVNTYECSSDSQCTGQGPCKGCIGCYCQDDDSKCTGECHTCSGGNCIDDQSKCNAANCETCVGGNCEYQCDPATQVCCDGICTPKCENTPPTGSCDTSYNEECLGCTVIPHICSSFTMKVYYGNEVHYCTGGCPGDCVQQNAVECYVEYECKYGIQQEYSICGEVGEGVDCIDLPFLWYCSPCVKNNNEWEIEYAYPKECQ